MRTSQHPRRSRLAVSVAGLIALSGCSLPAPDPPTPDVPVVELEVPAELTRTTPSVSYRAFLPPSSSRPALIAGRSAEAAGADRPTVWSSANGSTWVQTPLGAPVGGELVDLAGAGDTVAAVVAGTSWSAGKRTAWVLRSVDGQDWEPVTLPDGVPSNPALLGVAVTGGTGVLLVADTEGGWHAVRTGPDGGVSRLPDAGEDVLRDDVVVQAAAGRVVVLTRQGLRDSTRPTMSYLSKDAGSTWAKPVEAMDATFGVTGAAADDVGLVATGWQRPSPDAELRPAAWRSVDGLTWTPEPVPVPEWLADVSQQRIRAWP